MYVKAILISNNKPKVTTNKGRIPRKLPCPMSRHVLEDNIPFLLITFNWHWEEPHKSVNI